MATKGRAGSVRLKALDSVKLAKAERHGKREDDSSKSRRVDDIPPVVWGTLDLQKAAEKHCEGAKRTANSKTKALHAFVQFPTDIEFPADPKEREEFERTLVFNAVNFINKEFGGKAVFAARLDRDERGKHGVDVFFMPRHTHTYKDGRQVEKISISKHNKERARRLEGKDTKQAQGQSLQTAFYDHFKPYIPWLERGTRKWGTEKDRLSPEAYGLKQDRERLDKEMRELARRYHELDEREAAIIKREQAARAVVESAKEQAALLMEAVRNDAVALGRAIHFPNYADDPNSKASREAVRAAVKRREGQSRPVHQLPSAPAQQAAEKPRKRFTERMGFSR